LTAAPASAQQTTGEPGSPSTLAFDNTSGIGRSGTGVLEVDGKEVARQTMDHTIPLIPAWN